MAKPIDPLPERELCQYEKIRENILNEREEVMDRYNFLENRNDAKRKMLRKQTGLWMKWTVS